MKLFKIMETAFDSFDTTVSNYLSKALGSIGRQYSHNQIFGVIFDGMKGIMQNIMFYIEDGMTEQNVDTATRKESVYSLCKLSGYEAFYGSTSSGILIASMFITNALTSKSSKIYINNGCRVQNKNTGITYIINLPVSYYVIDISKPLMKHQFQILQGYYTSSSYIAKGYSLETVHIASSELFDKDYCSVYVDGEKWTMCDNLYDMIEDGHEYMFKIGYDNTIDVIFGNGVHGKKLEEGQTVIVKILKHNGSTGNILPDAMVDFNFLDYGQDTMGNSINLNDYLTLKMDSCISGGSDADSIKFMKNMIGTNSRSLVYASEDNFKLFFKRFSFIGYVNCWSEANSMYLMATCLKNIESHINDVSDFYDLSDEDLLLNDEQKIMVQNTLNNSKHAFAGITLKFQDPVIRHFAFIVYVKIKNVYSKEIVENDIKTNLATFFINNLEDTQFIAKSDIITLLGQCNDDITSVDVDIISELAEKSFEKGYYEQYQLKFVDGIYQYKTDMVIYEEDLTPGMDIYGNISLDTKIEIPFLHGGFYYYPNKKENDKTTKVRIETVQVYFT